jgi:hypothetical protein
MPLNIVGGYGNGGGRIGQGWLGGQWQSISLVTP